MPQGMRDNSRIEDLAGQRSPCLQYRHKLGLWQYQHVWHSVGTKKIEMRNRQFMALGSRAKSEANRRGFLNPQTSTDDLPVYIRYLCSIALRKYIILPPSWRVLLCGVAEMRARRSIGNAAQVILLQMCLCGSVESDNSLISWLLAKPPQIT